MKSFSRRDVLKSSLLAPAVVAANGFSPLTMAEPANIEPATKRAEDASVAKVAGSPDRLLLDFGWRFHLGHATDSTKDFGFGGDRAGNFQKTGNFLPIGSAAYDDSAWRNVDLPHDWAIELPFTNDPALSSKGYYPIGRAYPETSVGWYRRIFDLAADTVGQRIFLEFDGSYRETMVVFNGFYIGRHSGGYDPIRFDVTDFANPGQRNVLLVRVDATSSDGWFYEGAGLYRHVWLVTKHPVHVQQWGTFVQAEVRSSEASLSIRTEVNNHDSASKNVRVLSTILDPSGKSVAKGATPLASISEAGEQNYLQQITVKRPQLWSLEERNLYTLVTEIEAGGDIVDRHETRFGIRSIKFDPARGFLLNGQPVKLKGTCNHQDHAAVGVAVPDALHDYRIRKLQEMGCNALRTSHNPPPPELLDACDELGMLVFDETRMMSSNPEGLSQFSNLIRRDRNHPSVFMWSMGNEEGQANGEKGVRILTAMKTVATEHDGTRPVSIAPVGAIGTGGLAVCDVVGYNYMDPAAEAFHKEQPDRPVVGTETVSAVSTRGIYITDPKKGFVSSYDPYTTTGRASAEGWWSFCAAREWLSGGFVWTGFDYRGEPSPNQWPNISSQYGVIDTCGFPKDTFFYYQAWWTQKPVLHLFPHWNWPGYEGKTIAVWVHSNLEEVELFLNGKSLGKKAVKKDSHVAWTVPYKSGSIEAKGFKGGKEVMTEKRETTGSPAKLTITADRTELSANGEDVANFAVSIQDAQGRLVPITDNDVTFRVTGKGKLLGTGNGDPTNQQPDKGSTRKAFGGLCMVLAQASKEAGSITVEATSPGLTPAKVTIATKAVKLRPQVPVWERQVPTGSGITGLWRPVPAKGGGNMMAGFLGIGGDMVFSLQQEGSTLSGSVDSGGGGFFGGSDLPSPIRDARIDGDQVTFTAGMTTYKGSLKGDRLELDRTFDLPFKFSPPSKPAADAPMIGPPPDGSDPSLGTALSMPSSFPITLQRAKR